MADQNEVAKKTAAAWNAPGGGFDQFKKGDPQREKDLPPGAPLPVGSTPGNYGNTPAQPKVPKDHPLQRLRSKRSQ